MRFGLRAPAFDLRSAVFALLLAFVPVSALTIVSQFAGHGEAHYYGGPIPVGVSSIDLIFGSPRPTTFFAPFFVLDLLITAVIFYAIGRQVGLVGAIAACGAAVAALAALALAVAMVAMRFEDVGLPFPASSYDRGPLPAASVLWADMVIWAVTAAAVARLLGRMTSCQSDIDMARSSDLSRPR